MSVDVNSSTINYNNLYSEPNANSTLNNNLYNYSSATNQSSVNSSPAAVYSSSQSYSFGTYNSQGCTTPPTSSGSISPAAQRVSPLIITAVEAALGTTLTAAIASTPEISTTPPTSSGSISDVSTAPPTSGLSEAERIKFMKEIKNGDINIGTTPHNPDGNAQRLPDISTAPPTSNAEEKSNPKDYTNISGISTAPPTSDFTELSYKGTGNANSSMFGKSSYLEKIEKIEKKSGCWAAMNKIMDDINDNHKAFINEDYNKVSDLYNKIDLYAKVILGGEIYSSSQRQKVHYFRNQLNRAPETLAELGAQSSNWRILNVGDSTFHMQGDNGLMNLKFVSTDGRFEAVYNEKGKLVTDSINMGTYNYAPKTTEGIVPHTLFDVDPYYRWGNTSDSPQKGFLEITLATNGIKSEYEGDKKAQKHRKDIIEKYNFIEV